MRFFSELRRAPPPDRSEATTRSRSPGTKQRLLRGIPGGPQPSPQSLLLRRRGVGAGLQPPGFFLALPRREAQAEPLQRLRVIQLFGRRQPLPKRPLQVGPGHLLRGLAELVRRE